MHQQSFASSRNFNNVKNKRFKIKAFEVKAIRLHACMSNLSHLNINYNKSKHKRFKKKVYWSKSNNIACMHQQSFASSHQPQQCKERPLSSSWWPLHLIVISYLHNRKHTTILYMLPIDMLFSSFLSEILSYSIISITFPELHNEARSFIVEIFSWRKLSFIIAVILRFYQDVQSTWRPR